jgi:phosphohistidine phosphatase
MRTLYLLRHAKSRWDEPGCPDSQRRLAPRGVRDAKLIAKHLRRLGVAPELVLCSSAVRTRETLELVLPALGAPAVRVEDELYGAASEVLLERLYTLPEEIGSVLLIGHNPGLQDLALTLVSSGGDRARLAAKFPTSALATLTLASWRPDPGDAELVGYVVPKELR